LPPAPPADPFADIDDEPLDAPPRPRQSPEWRVSTQTVVLGGGAVLGLALGAALGAGSPLGAYGVAVAFLGALTGSVAGLVVGWLAACAIAVRYKGEVRPRLWITLPWATIALAAVAAEYFAGLAGVSPPSEGPPRVLYAAGLGVALGLLGAIPGLIYWLVTRRNPPEASEW
jgi:hypothetical protein